MKMVKIGKLCEPDAERDAIHVAIAPVVAGDTFNPGTHIGFLDEVSTVEGEKAVGPCKTNIGIADPFLKQTIIKGQRFYVFLYPNTVTSIRHHWTHYAFSSKDTEESVAWMKSYISNYCRYDVQKNGIDAAYLEFMKGASEGHLHFWGSEITGRYELPQAEEFARHLSILLGEEIDLYDENAFTYSCSC